MRSIMTGTGAVAILVLAATGPAMGADLRITPNSGVGRPGEAITISGSGYPPSATVTITVGGAGVLPAQIQSEPDGSLRPTVVLLAKPVPAGRHAAGVSGAANHTFAGAFTVRPVVSLDPPIGSGQAGATWRTDEEIAAGGYSGMVFILTGTGFPAGAFIPGDSIAVGKAPTVHDPIRIGEGGILESTTIVVASNLPAGRYDITLSHADGRTSFPAMYHVAPWDNTDKLRRRTAARKVSDAETAIQKLVKESSKLLPAEELAALGEDLKKAEAALKSKNFDESEDFAHRIQERVEILANQADQMRADKLSEMADVIASGFDKLQPPGSPPHRTAAKVIERGRETLAEGRSAIEKGDFEAAGTLLKAANATLQKAQQAAGVKENTEAPVRW